VAQGLSLLFEITAGDGSDDGSDPVTGLSDALTSGGSSSPQILHYAWVVDMTEKVPPKTGIKTLLLTTVYDEDFADYISDLVTANPTPFNNAAKIIVGLGKAATPVQSPENLPKFIEFVRQNDLTGGGTAPGFFEAYDANVVTILAALGE
jgi:hypothetical protein